MSFVSSVLVCPVCKGPLLAGRGERKEFVCPSCALAYEVAGGIPCMIPSHARELGEEEAEQYRKIRDEGRAAASGEKLDR